MRTESLNGALLSTLIIVSLMVPVITLLSVSPASASNSEIYIIVQGDANAFNYSRTGDMPWRWYEADDNPPIMAAREIPGAGEVFGRVVAAGVARLTNAGENYKDKVNWGYGVSGFDVLLDVALRWLKPDNTEPIKVLWYGAAGENYDVYNDALKASWLIDNLRAKGYEIDNKADAPITSGLLDPYDVLILPGLQIGERGTGGDPNWPDTGPDVSAIDSFVRGGGGLFIMETGDWDGRNYYKVNNKILDELEFGMRFQMDTVVDPDSLESSYYLPGMGAVFEADVNNVLFGADYIIEAKGTRVQVYKVPSLAPPPEKYGVSVKISHSYLEGLKGGKLECKVTVSNVGKTKDNFELVASGPAGWTLKFEDTLENITELVLENITNEENTKSTTLWVTIPQEASIGTEGVVTVTATSTDNENASHSTKFVAIVGNRVRPTTADAMVIEAKPDEKQGDTGWMYVGSSATGLHKNENTFLKFDLKALGTASVDNVRLYIYGFSMMGAPDKTVQLHRVDENWWEDNITWSTAPLRGELLRTATVSDSDLWYSWDVTDYVGKTNVQGQRNINNLASFTLSYETPSESYPENWSYGFDAREYGENLKHPYLATGYSVSTEVREPKYKEGMRGGTLSCKVLVQNTGALLDTYTLSVSENVSPSWASISPNSLTLGPGEFYYATVTVTIPLVATIGENIDNITVVATSTVSDNDWFVVNVSETNIKPPEDDSTAKYAEPVGNCVWGTFDKIEVGRESGGPIRGFLKFDLSAIPPGTDIKRAKLWLNAEEVDDVGAVVRVHRVDDNSWVERGAGRLMWKNQGNQPTIGEVLDVRVVVAGDKQYFWDVTSYVKKQYENENGNVVSFALVDLGENIPPDLHAARFTSKDPKLREPKVIRENHPYLEILTTPPDPEVRAYISPVFQGGIGVENATLEYIVTVKNMGTEIDTYTLENKDTRGWLLRLDNTSLAVPAGENRTTPLSVTIGTGEVCDLDRITVTVTGTGTSDSAIAFAHYSDVGFELENLYKISIDPNLLLREDADKLVAKFYTLEDDNRGERVVWENMPWHLTSKIDVPHPQGLEAVEKVRLVLVDEAGAEIATVASSTVRRSSLMKRIGAIKGEWPYADAAKRSALMKEIGGIKGRWVYAPA